MRQEALDWLNEGEMDLRRPRRSLDAEDDSWSCFECNQAVEKIMKALIIGLRRRTPPRTHDLTELYHEVADAGLHVSESELPDLSQYYVTTRYPNAGLHRPSQSFTRTQAERAIGIAERIHSDASRLLTT